MAPYLIVKWHWNVALRKCQNILPNENLTWFLTFSTYIHAFLYTNFPPLSSCCQHPRWKCGKAFTGPCLVPVLYLFFWYFCLLDSVQTQVAIGLDMKNHVWAGLDGSVNQIAPAHPRPHTWALQPIQSRSSQNVARSISSLKYSIALQDYCVSPKCKANHIGEGN